jgi:predicted CDP-diglyceride synthetase/phosphatidate cytidylyltransferase
MVFTMVYTYIYICVCIIQYTMVYTNDIYRSMSCIVYGIVHTVYGICHILYT